MEKYSYQISWSAADAAYVALSPEFPGLSGLGETTHDALVELNIAIELAVETIVESGAPPPSPQMTSEYSGQFRLRLPRSLHQSLAVRCEAEGVSLNTLAVMYLARAMGQADAETRTSKQYRRVLDDWLQVMRQLQGTMVRFDQSMSETTHYPEGTPPYQDPMLRHLYDQSKTIVIGHRESEQKDA